MREKFTPGQASFFSYPDGPHYFTVLEVLDAKIERSREVGFKTLISAAENAARSGGAFGYVARANQPNTYNEVGNLRQWAVELAFSAPKRANFAILVSHKSLEGTLPYATAVYVKGAVDFRALEGFLGRLADSYNI